MVYKPSSELVESYRAVPSHLRILIATTSQPKDLLILIGRSHHIWSSRKKDDASHDGSSCQESTKSMDTQVMISASLPWSLSLLKKLSWRQERGEKERGEKKRGEREHSITSGRPGKTTQATTARAVRRTRRGDDFCLSALVAFSFEKIIMETRERGEREGREGEGTLSEGGGNMEGKGKTKEGESGTMDEKGRGTKEDHVGEREHRCDEVLVTENAFVYLPSSAELASASLLAALYWACAITSGRPGKTTQATTARAVRRARRGDDFCLSALVAFSFEKIIMETREREEREGREEEGREGTLSEGGGNMEGKGKTKEGESGMMDEKGRGTKEDHVGEREHRCDQVLVTENAFVYLPSSAELASASLLAALYWACGGLLAFWQ
ncbi:hypothetical protein PROFUN_16649 [Planoprotostelium fungivorum]|uniref:Uncharacterized protein n=1 Tax=Planoprotostelium fungivorum TaxID=1890364 RepID=A0A2P6MN06_9EUKA|nr:hypothetical protein PROFUN_16649 [Planoprotostelium fungivorum]